MPVTVIGNDLKDQFFADADPIGKCIMMEGRPFEVIGVAKTKGTVFGNSHDDFRPYSQRPTSRFMARAAASPTTRSATDAPVLEQAQDEIRMLLRALPASAAQTG